MENIFILNEMQSIQQSNIIAVGRESSECAWIVNSNISIALHLHICDGGKR